MPWLLYLMGFFPCGSANGWSRSFIIWKSRSRWSAMWSVHAESRDQCNTNIYWVLKPARLGPRTSEGTQAGSQLAEQAGHSQKEQGQVREGQATRIRDRGYRKVTGWGADVNQASWMKDQIRGDRKAEGSSVSWMRGRKVRGCLDVNKRIGWWNQGLVRTSQGQPGVSFTLP